jgi:flagellar biosynthesis/type III secretory pathway protein FliH
MARRETVAQAYQRGRDEGLAEGFASAKMALEAEQRRTASSARAHQLELMKAVTQLVSVGGQAVQSLAQVYDNGPRS